MSGAHGHGHGDRSRSFGTVAAEYDRLRPGPAPESIAWVLPPGATTVVDLGAGTGLLSRAVAEAGVRDVVAVEPDERMRAHLHDTGVGIRALEGVAEEIPLPDACADAVVAASAWHWFDEDLATREVARVLRPGGVLGLLWSYADPATPWVAEARALGQVAQHGSAPLAETGFVVTLPGGSPFATGETRMFGRRAPMSLDDVVAMFGTYSSVLTQPAEQQAAVLREIRTLVEDRVGEGPIDVPFTTAVWRTQRF